MKNIDYLIDHDEVKEIISASSSTLYRLRKQGDFPKPVEIFERKLVWKLSDIQGFIQQKDAPKKTIH